MGEPQWSIRDAIERYTWEIVVGPLKNVDGGECLSALGGSVYRKAEYGMLFRLGPPWLVSSAWQGRIDQSLTNRNSLISQSCLDKQN